MKALSGGLKSKVAPESKYAPAGGSPEKGGGGGGGGGGGDSEGGLQLTAGALEQRVRSRAGA